MVTMIAATLMLAPVAEGSAQPSVNADAKCTSAEAGAIVVCGSGLQPYRIDPDVTAGQQAAQKDRDDARAAVPAAQAACAASPMGCGKGLEGLDWINVAAVAGMAAMRAVRGEDWTKPLRPAGPGEYQRYQEAKKAREERSADRAALRLREQARAKSGQ